MSNIGWIKLHRKILNWEWYGDVNVCRVYIHLLLTANFEEKKWNGIVLNKGDCTFTLGSLSEILNLSCQQIRTALEKLKTSNNITILSTSRYHRINITKYNSFLGEELNNKIDNFDNQQKKQRSNNKSSTSLKEINNNLKNTNSNELVQKGHRLDTKLELPEAWKAYALQKGYVEPEKTFECFKNYWTSANAKKPFKKDWFATWRNWILREINQGFVIAKTKPESANPYEGMSATEIFKARGIEL